MNRPSSPVKLGGGLFVFSLGWPEFGWGFLGFILVGGENHIKFGAALPVLDLCEGVETSSHPRGGVWFPAASRLLGGGGCYW